MGRKKERGREPPKAPRPSPGSVWKTENQRVYLESIAANDVVFCVGPAGTGKTYLAIKAACDLLVAGKVSKIVLCRPAVQSGEDLGFLPGDAREKMDPYLQPVYDALNDVVGSQAARDWIRDKVVEVAPLAYMRGRTFHNAIMILDEAQNTNVIQMKMFLTRMGNGSKMIVNGDVTQVDLDKRRVSGLVDAMDTLSRIPGVAWVRMEGGDIVRHPLVQKIVEAYEAKERGKK